MNMEMRLVTETPKLLEINEHNHTSNLESHLQLSLFSAVFNCPKPTVTIPSRPQQTEVQQIIIPRADYKNAKGEGLSLVAYFQQRATDYVLIAWEQYADMLARKAIFERWVIEEYRSGYISGRSHFLLPADGGMYTLWQRVKYVDYLPAV